MSQSLNLSEYQKVIFINNIDEGVQGTTTSLKELSMQYPFAVFFTSNSVEQHAGNIWSNGERLTRFIDIDPEHNTINVGDHEFKLSYDHNTGKIGIFDKNPLNSIKILKITYDDPIFGKSTSLNVNTSSVRNFEIDSINNEFIMNVEFNSDSTAGNDANVVDIPKAIKAYEGSSNALTNTFEFIKESPYNPNTTYQQNVDFTGLVKEDTSALNFKEYKIVSSYVSSAFELINLKAYLNPVDYDMIYDNKSVQNGATVEQVQNQDVVLRINFTNSAIQSNSNYTMIYVNATSSDSSIVSVEDQQVAVYNGTASIRLKVHEGPKNASTKATINIKVTRRKGLNASIETYKNLSKYFDVSVRGEVSENYAYWGFENPTDSSFDTSKFIEIADDTLYDWEDHINEIRSNAYNNFYIAVPLRSPMKPRVDIYTTNNGKKEYIANEEAFNSTTANIMIGEKEIPFRVYTSKIFTGYYIGKVN